MMKLSQITQVLFAMAFSSTHSYLIIYVFHLIKFEMLVFITDTQRLLLNTMFVYFFLHKAYQNLYFMVYY